MRILKVTQVYHPFLAHGGPAFKVRAIAERLAARGHRVTVLTTSLGPQQPPGAVNSGGVETVYLRPVLRWRATSLNAGLRQFCRERLGEFDLVHIYGLYDWLGPVVARHCRRVGLPYIIEPLGMMRPIDRSFRLKRLWHLLAGGAYLGSARSLIATSEQERQEMLDDGFQAARVFLRYNGLDLGDLGALPLRGSFRQAHGIAPDEPLALFLGRLIPRKGADLLLTSFFRACPDRGRLVIAGPEGEPGYREALRQQAAALGVESRVIFAGPLYGEQKKAALVDADVFVLPSRYENFANAAAEAIACSTPVIVSDACGISRLVDGRVGLVVPPAAGPLGQALSRFFEDAALRERFRAACTDVAASLSWDQLLGPMERHYLELAERQNGQR